PNASGLTMQESTGSMWMIINCPAQLLEINNDRVVRTIKLQGFNDTEGICWICDDIFVIAEERETTLNVVRINVTTECISKEEVIDTLYADIQVRKNKGIEGLCFDRESNELLFVTEKKPIRLFRVKLAGDKLSNCREVKVKTNFEWTMRDASGVSIVDNRVAILSDESSSINFYNRDGELKDQLLLKRGYNNIESVIPQAEGICTDAEGNLYVCSEPNLFYKFSKK
ncbi:MAG: SdiA-regulated domain-containing protein, partial [Lentisphaeraceae bacterium]|nr:SdiA-regulated domain-containing protein [Lentisphaeraceae bacterium]